MWKRGMDFLFLALICAVVGRTLGLGTLCDHLRRRK
jgi:hypothetical protein